jgi:hypothetical protein
MAPRSCPHSDTAPRAASQNPRSGSPRSEGAGGRIYPAPASGGRLPEDGGDGLPEGQGRPRPPRVAASRHGPSPRRALVPRLRADLRGDRDRGARRRGDHPDRIAVPEVRAAGAAATSSPAAIGVGAPRSQTLGWHPRANGSPTLRKWDRPPTQPTKVASYANRIRKESSTAGSLTALQEKYLVTRETPQNGPKAGKKRAKNGAKGPRFWYEVALTTGSFESGPPGVA